MDSVQANQTGAMTMSHQSQPAASTMTPAYGLGRGYTSASRLNYQDYLWHSVLSFHIHPTIERHLCSKPSDQIRIAELACGTAIWATEVAHRFPAAQVTASDLSLEQCPPPAWLPKNLSTREWNIFDDLPEDWLGQFDLVHIRLVQLVMDDGRHVTQLLEKLKRMLKTDGWMQWDESFTSQSYVLCEEGEDSCPSSISRLGQLLTSRPTNWIGHLDSTMRDAGFGHAVLQKYYDEAWIARAFFGMYLMMEEEFTLTSKAGTKDGLEMLDNVGRMWRDSSRGSVVCAPKVVAIGTLADVGNGQQAECSRNAYWGSFRLGYATSCVRILKGIWSFLLAARTV